MATALNYRLEQSLAQRDARLTRYRLRTPGTPWARDGAVDFMSNDYLGFAQSSKLRDLLLEQLHTTKSDEVLGAGSSRAMINPPAHAKLEARCAQYFGASAALLFNSGFDANLGFWSCVPGPEDIIVLDEYVHASTHEGIRLGRTNQKNIHIFAHNDVSALDSLCENLVKTYPGLKNGYDSVFIALESVYSMEGSVAPLPALLDVIDRHFPEGNGLVFVDDAHGTGVYGPQGRGIVVHYGVETRIFARLVTFNKALGCTGATLLVSPLVRDYLINYSRPFIYSTTLASMDCIAVSCAIDLLEDGTGEAAALRVRNLSEYFLSGLRSLLHGVPPKVLSLPPHLASQTASEYSPTIIPLLTPHAQPLRAYFASRGMTTQDVNFPVVPKGLDRVRVCIHATNTHKDIDRLLQACSQWISGLTTSAEVEGLEELGTLVNVPQPKVVARL